MSRPKTDPVEETFRRWVALSPEQQRTLMAMIAGYRAAIRGDGPAVPPHPRKRAQKPAVTEVA